MWCSLHSPVLYSVVLAIDCDPVCPLFSPPPQLSSGPSLLPEMTPQDQGKICVVIDLDETLVHSSFKVATAFPPTHCYMWFCKGCLYPMQR